MRRLAKKLSVDRIRIGNRHFAGYLHNFSMEGAKLGTVSSIRKIGRVYLALPDLPAILASLVEMTTTMRASASRFFCRDTSLLVGPRLDFIQRPADINLE